MRSSVFILLLFPVTIFSQPADTARAIITYQFSQVRDTTNRSSIQTDIFFLYVGKETSLYSNYDLFQPDSILGANSGRQLNRTLIKKNVSIELLKDPAKRLVLQKEHYFLNNYLISDTLPVINWRIEQDTKNIKGFVCQKAIGKCLGRIYEAWFCSDLPIADGPWKLNGLPGLIMEAEDSRHEIKFNFLAIDNSPSQQKEIGLFYTDLIKTNKKDFLKIVRAGNADPVTMFLHSANSKGLGTATVTVPANYKPPLTRFSNPIELEQ